MIDWFNIRFGGEPRTLNAAPSFCESVSNVARDRYQSKADEKWPETFKPELERVTAQAEATVREIYP